MKHKFSWLVGLLSLLLFSGQAFAATLTSAADAAWGTVGGTAGFASLPTNADDVVIANAVTGVANMVAKTLVINSTKSFAPGSNTITLSGNFTSNGTFTNANSTVAFNAAATVTGTVTFLNLTTSAALTLAADTTVAGVLTVNSGGSIVLAAANAVTGGVTLAGTGTISGTLGLTNTDHAIATAADINLTGITVASGTTAMTLTLSPAGGKTINVGTISSTAAITLTCNNGAGSVASMVAGSITNYTCIGLSTPAPVFSTKEKAKVFGEEVKN